ncbi:dnaJ homolog subfamily C member 1-like [Sinocyclocheilus rhinocerous]|uniref:DnaJ homolog subfamily C member 1 n=1 Tax=Sinocyclocheilus rhinocerous TaxID=307959 RepID=A0A673H3N1_9TELE|nr:PREDICTED: dnaJ homolog subfamily C member 1-like [Sinocyclocheilus rhinocerous]
MALPEILTLVLFSVLAVIQPLPTLAWDADLELFDLVEEIPQTFYEFLSVNQDASSSEIRKAYRKLSLTLHPDKNKDENAENQFRQLVAIYEVLKDEERRQRYDDILVNGLPDWRQPVFYYRRVRKMSNGELGFLLFLILTVGHYAVIWSIYLEKQLDELLSRKKREKKKKQSSKMTDEIKSLAQDKNERSDRPHWHDILPLKLSIWLYYSVKSLPHIIQDVKQYYKDYKEMKVKEEEEAEALAEQEMQQKEKRPKVKKPKVEFPVYEPNTNAAFVPVYDQGTSIEDIEDQMDYWLEDKKQQKTKTQEWTEEDLSQLSRCMAKFPGGTPGRWEKIAHELGRSVTEVTTKVKQVKDCVTNTSGLVKLSELKGAAVMGKSSRAVTVPDSLMTQREEPLEQQLEDSAEPAGAEDSESKALRRRTKKSAAGSAGTGEAEERMKGRRQRDFDPTAVDDDSEDEKKPSASKEKPSSAEDVWTQNQQKLLELALQQYPRGTTERWDKIAKVVPGKTKEECMSRYKLLAELIQKRKQAKS